MNGTRLGPVRCRDCGDTIPYTGRGRPPQRCKVCKTIAEREPVAPWRAQLRLRIAQIEYILATEPDMHPQIRRQWEQHRADYNKALAGGFLAQQEIEGGLVLRASIIDERDVSL